MDTYAGHIEYKLTGQESKSEGFTATLITPDGTSYRLYRKGAFELNDSFFKQFDQQEVEVNGELEELKKALASAVPLLNPGGRLCVISFHSLEDRIVKNFFREMAETCKCPPGLPVCVCGWKPVLKIVTKHPVTADDVELAENPRAACAKLRAAEKIQMAGRES